MILLNNYWHNFGKTSISQKSTTEETRKRSKY